jgi:hypothetical protein
MISIANTGNFLSVIVLFDIGERKGVAACLHGLENMWVYLGTQRIGWKDWDGDDAGLEEQAKKEIVKSAMGGMRQRQLFIEEIRKNE